MEIRAEDGWLPCVGSGRPPFERRHMPAEFARKEWETPMCCNWIDLPDWTNMIGLYWRPRQTQQAPAGGVPNELRRADTDSGQLRSIQETSEELGRGIPGVTSFAPIHRIVHAWHDDASWLYALGSNGRIFRLPPGGGAWQEIRGYPPGLEP